MANPLWAKAYLEVKEELTVYSKPNDNGQVIGKLLAGERVRYSTKVYGSFRKVRAKLGGRWRIGFIRRVDMRRSEVDRKSPLAKRRALGLSLVGTYASQGDRQFETGSGEYTASEFSGTTSFFQAFYDWPFSQKWQGRVFFTARKAILEGEAQLDDSLSATTFEFEESFYGVGILFKRYFTGQKFWLGMSSEYADGQELKVEVLDGTPLDESEADAPLFFIGSLHLGYDFRVSENIYLVTESRIGTVFSTDPFTILTEAVLSVAYGL